MNRFLVAVSPFALVAIATPAFAGEEVLYAETPGWVVPADIDAAIDKGEELVLLDRQIRMEGGVVHRYSDIAYKIENSQSLTRLGTLQFAWMPDKGDLTIHRLELIRGDEVIDLVANGVEANVIRREKELEKRTVNGQLTAVVAVPGMVVGDVLRFTSSTTMRDQALGDEMQVGEGLVARPGKLGFGRLRISWPDGAGVNWKAIGQLETPEAEMIDGYRTIEVAMPVAEPEEMPEDAPARFRLNPAIQASTFETWQDVAHSMAPHFTTEGKIEDGGAIAQQVARIERATDKPLERAALALQVVQDEVSYLMNGLDGGNYLPQSPEDTWALRYGDCKAKSLLLLAMLREMGIEAQAVLVKSKGGDAVSVMQPLPGAFDHMIVRAQIDGLDYWLDGTSAGARLDTMHEVPSFAYALPLIAEETDLVRLEQRWPIAPDRKITVTYDMSGGVDMPYLFDAVVETRGTMASALKDKASENDAFLRLDHANGYLEKLVPGVIYQADYSFDEETGVATLRARGIEFDAFKFDRNIATHKPNTASANWGFAPDRARKAWRDIPYQVGGPMTAAQDATYLLPADAGLQIKGTQKIDDVVAGTRLRRDVTRDGDTLRIVDSSSYVPRELSPEQIGQEKVAMQRLSSGDIEIRIEDPRRYWDMDEAELAEIGKRYDAAMARMIAAKDDVPEFYNLRAALRSMGRDYDGALKDLGKAIELDAIAESYSLRADVYYEIGQLDKAAEDSRRVYELTGELDDATSLAKVLSENGQEQEALELLDDLGLTGEEGHSMAMVWAEIAGPTERREEAWSRLDEALADRPGDGSLLNAQCWFVGTWEYNLEEGEAICDRAVREGNYSAASLDSRALVYHRLGQSDKAMQDLEAALRKEPGQAASMYLRGIIMIEQGDKRAGMAEIERAKRQLPSIERTYRRYGIQPGK